jgi:hypothetical protein
VGLPVVKMDRACGFGQPHSLEGEAMGVKDIVTGLTTTGTKALGKGLVEAAQEKNREAMQGAVVGKVQEILVHVQKQKDYIAQSEANVDLLEAAGPRDRAGEFTVSSTASSRSTTRTLRAGVVRMAECTNCGYSGRKSV